MLRENPMQPDFDFEQSRKFEDWLIHIIERGNKPFNKDPNKLREKSIKKIDEKYKILYQENGQLNTENVCLKKKLELLNQQLTIQSEGILVKPFKKVSGNWLYKRVETERYIKTYICGICTRKRPANLCKYIDTGLQELEKRLKTFILNNK